ncbi:Putative 115 kDa protein in type-1 retrotransposable element R1DM [Eumeta japonica]|uniref:115 kDa protein in type-1 retrotransposable element R1DM n=1 Tax=Eumeta variegata TaxID=151549 RepID=A0A4C1YEM8_EUMVA|nr:Putative 115 kDa protein in type-1 retrotransposable element R1DM [Eumeta japonica]
MVSLDIEGAFDNAWWPALETQLRAQKCPVNLHGMVRGYLRDREVLVRQKLKFILHVAKACKKAANIYKTLARADKTTWGLSPEVVRTIYITVIGPIVLYASCAWAPATRKLSVRKMLDAVQRSVALKACRAHRTVSLHSVLILSKLLLST